MTAATTATISKQKTFNQVYRGLAKQGFRQSIDGTMCKYRDQSGRACAAGQLISDQFYTRSIEGGTVKPDVCRFSSTAVHQASALIEQLGHDLVLVQNLQQAHDHADDPLSMKLRLHRVAKDHGLKVPRVPVSKAPY